MFDNKKYQKEYYKANLQRVRAQRAQFAKEHPARVAEWILRASRRRRAAYNDGRKDCRLHLLKLMLRTHNRRAGLQAVPAYFTPEQWLAKIEFWNWRCHRCGKTVTLETVTIDQRRQVAPGGVNWIAGIAPACLSCNGARRKGPAAEAAPTGEVPISGNHTADA